jgi:hypothetical protein
MSGPADKFNRTFVEFVDDLAATQPNNVEYGVFAMALRGLVMASPTKVQTTFYNEVAVPFAERILARDEAFFLEKDYADTRADSGIVQKIKAVYGDMSVDDRAVVFRYMRLLVLLSRKIFEA